MARDIEIFTHEFFPKRAGIAIYIEETARAAAELGHRVCVHAPRSAALRRLGASYAVEPLPISGGLGWPGRLATMRRLSTVFSSLGPDTCVWLPEPGPILAAVWLLRLGRFPEARRCILTLHGSEMVRFQRKGGERRMFRELVRRCGGVSVVSEYGRSLLARLDPVAAERALVLPGALRSGFRARADASRASPGSKTADGKLRVLTVARIHPRKGQLAVVDALGALPGALRARVVYQLAGPATRPAYLEAIRGQAMEQGVHLEVLGEVADADLPEVLAGADVFAMTPLPHRDSVEGFGLSYLEAGAAGLSVVAHAIGGVPEAVEEGVTGLLVPPEARGELTGALKRLLEDAGLRRRLGEAGRQRALSGDWHQLAQRLFAG